MPPVTFYRHPDYTRTEKRWREYKDWYEGLHEVLRRPEYLIAHELESTGRADASLKRTIREDRSQYTNIMEPVVSRLGSLAFKELPDISEVEPMFGKEITNVDGYDTSLLTFLKEHVAPVLFLYGKPCILVEGPNDRAINKEQERAQGLRPYLHLLPPLELVDWDIETKDPARRGQYNWFRTEYHVIGTRGPLDEPQEVRYSKLYQLAPGGGFTVTLYRGKKKKAAAASLPTTSSDYDQPKDEYEWEQEGGAIPVPGWDHLPLSVLTGPSWVKDVAPLVKRFFNQESALDNQLLYQAHQRTFIISDLDTSEKLALSETTVTFLPPGSSVVTVEPINTAPMRDRMEQTLVLLSKVAFNQGRSLPMDSRAVEGADTIRESKEDFVELVISTIEDLENLTNQFIADYALMKGVPNFAGKVKFSRNVTVEDVAEARADFLSIRNDIVKVPVWHKSYLKKAAQRQGYPNIKEIEDAIESTDFTPPEPMGFLEEERQFGRPEMNENDEDNEDQEDEEG